MPTTTSAHCLSNFPQFPKDLPQITLGTALNAREQFPFIRALIPGPKEQLLHILRQINPLTVSVSAAAGLMTGRWLKSRAHTMRNPEAELSLTREQRALFARFLHQQNHVLRRDLLASHRTTVDSTAQTAPPTLSQASSLEFARESLSRMHEGVWALASYSVEASGQLLATLSSLTQTSYTQVSALSRQVYSLFASKPSVPATAQTIQSHPVAVPCSNTPTLPFPRGLDGTAIKIGQPLPDVTIEGKGRINTDGRSHNYESWSTSDLPTGHPKILAYLPAKPNRRQELQPLGDKIDQRQFTENEFSSFTLVNLSDLPGQSGVLGSLNSFTPGINTMIRDKAEGIILKGAKQRPKMAIIVDDHSSAQQAWRLDRDTSYTFVLDTNNVVMTSIKGQPSDKEQISMLDWCERMSPDKTPSHI